MIEVIAKTYIGKGRKIRAVVESGPADVRGLHVRCPRVWRDEWAPDALVTMRGNVVQTGAAQNTGTQRREYFNAIACMQ